MIRPSRPDLEVVGVFNPAVTRHGAEVLLLLRVAEAPTKQSASDVAAPVFNAGTGQLDIKRWKPWPRRALKRRLVPIPKL